MRWRNRTCIAIRPAELGTRQKRQRRRHGAADGDPAADHRQLGEHQRHRRPGDVGVAQLVDQRLRPDFGDPADEGVCGEDDEPDDDEVLRADPP
jgi:hypothetical protein